MNWPSRLTIYLCQLPHIPIPQDFHSVRSAHSHSDPNLHAILRIMSLQPLYDLDRTFSDGLDKLLHDVVYVDALGRLPERELVQLVNHLNDVGFPFVAAAQLTTSIDHYLSRSRRWVIQKVPPRVAEDMWPSESPPHDLRIVCGQCFACPRAAGCVWRVL
jgi:hypothetical protein